MKVVRHADPGAVPPELNTGALTDDAADLVLADMLALQSPELADLAVTVANWKVFERQSKNVLYYKRVSKVARTSVEKAAAYFRREVWWFIHMSPKTRAKARKKEGKKHAEI